MPKLRSMDPNIKNHIFDNALLNMRQNRPEGCLTPVRAKKLNEQVNNHRSTRTNFEAFLTGRHLR
jgi:hypothetical protein